MMRLLISISFILLLSLPLRAQEPEIYRSDTLNVSIQLRYLIFSLGAGVEFPFRQHSFGLQVGQNYLPPEGNFFVGFNRITVAASEYKRYSPPARPGSLGQLYYGSHLLLMHTNYISPEEGYWDGNWYKSNSISIGPLGGWKNYVHRNVYFEFFAGLYGGWQWGQLRWNNEDPVTGKTDPTYQKASKGVWGTRMGISLGLHL